jgi:hypothetical protein
MAAATSQPRRATGTSTASKSKATAISKPSSPSFRSRLITGAPLGLKGRNALAVPIATGSTENSEKGFFLDEKLCF